MKLKGIFNEKESYVVDDVVYHNGRAYVLRKEAPKGTYPIDTGFWSQLGPETSTTVELILSYEKPEPKGTPVKAARSAKKETK